MTNKLTMDEALLVVEAINIAASRIESQAKSVKHGKHHDEKAKRMRELRSKILRLPLNGDCP